MARMRTIPPSDLTKEEAAYLRAAHERGQRGIAQAISTEAGMKNLPQAATAVETATEAIQRVRRANRRMNATGSRWSPSTKSER